MSVDALVGAFIPYRRQRGCVTPCTSNELFIGCALWTHLHQLCFKSLLEISCLHPHDILYCQRWHTPPQQRPRVQFTSRSSSPSSMSKCWLTMRWKTLSIVRGLRVRFRTCFRSRSLRVQFRTRFQSRKHTQTVTAGIVSFGVTFFHVTRLANCESEKAWTLQDGLDREDLKSGETLMEAHNDTDGQIVRHTWV